MTKDGLKLRSLGSRALRIGFAAALASALAFPVAGMAKEPSSAEGAEAQAAAGMELTVDAAAVDETGEGGAEGLSTQAVAGKDIMLGVFYTSAKDWTNSIYASYDGEVLYQVATTYNGGGPGKPYAGNHYAQKDASIMYHNGYFWSLSGWNLQNGKINLMVSYSKDLVHWTHPDGFDSSQNAIAVGVDSYPVDLNGNALRNFDIVAPEWSVTKNGQVYIVVSAGYYGDFHGQPTKDAMQVYSFKVSHLSASDGTPDGNTKYLWPRNLAFRASTAQKLSFSNYKKANFIDGAFYTDGGTDYLVVKKDGLTNQLYKTSNIDNAAGWTLVNGNMSYGYEGPSIAKIDGKYYLFGDLVSGATALGVDCVSSTSLTKNASWGAFHKPLYTNANNGTLTARHGTVITLKAGTPEWSVVKSLLDRQVKEGQWARVAGNTRYDTMSAIVSKGFAKCDRAIIATGANFPDALAASALAGAYQCPVILTDPNSLSTQAAYQLRRLGVKDVFILGGPGAVSALMDNQIRAITGRAPVRIAGQGRVETSLEIFKRFQEAAKTQNFVYDTVIIATSKNFPDTLSVSPYAYAKHAPIILTELVNDGKYSKLTPAALKAIKDDKNIKRAIIVGGTGVVSSEVEKQLSGYKIIRLQGSDRYGTSTEIAKWELGEGMNAKNPAVATGKNFPDALAGAVLSGKNDSILVLADEGFTSAVTNVLAPKKADIAQGYFYGGIGAVKPRVQATTEHATH